MSHQPITAEELRNQLTYDPNTGKFHWKHGQRRKQEAGTVGGNGYIYIKIGGRSGKVCLAHRLAWLYVHDIWPEELDHIDQNQRNNAIDNLREVNRSENMFNARLRYDNTTGYKGVSFNKRLNKYHAYIKINYKRVHLGFFQSVQEAKEAYERAANQLSEDRTLSHD